MAHEQASALPLQGHRSHARARRPDRVRQLADWGADVIKIETPGDDGHRRRFAHGPDFQNLHRNKRSITLNLKEPEGVAILKRLVESADVLVENYRPDVKFRLGIDYETPASPINPRLVYASISGFGQDGPYRDRPGFDQIAQGMGGLMSITGLAGPGAGARRHRRSPISAPASSARMGILLALLEREESGEGQWVQTSLLAAQIAMLDFQAARWLHRRGSAGPGRQQSSDRHSDRRLRTADGHINIVGAGQRDVRPLVQGAGRARARRPTRNSQRPRRGCKIATSSTRSSTRSPRHAQLGRMGRDPEPRPACPAARSTRWTRSSPIRRSSI